MPIVPELAFTVPQPAVNYLEVGGEMIPGAGGASPVTLVGPAHVTLANAAQVPLDYQNSGEFMIEWTYDGSDPRSGVPFEGDSFMDGFPGQDIPVTLERWPASATEMELRVLARSLGGPKSLIGPALLDSEIVGDSIAVDPLPLRPPLVEFASGSTSAAQLVELALDTASGDTPVGARIFYTLDGTEPTPENGVLWDPADGPISINSGSGTVTVESLAQEDVVWAIDKNNDKVVAVGDLGDIAGTTSDFGNLKYQPAGGGDAQFFTGKIGAVTIDQNNDAWIVANKAIAGYGSRPFFFVDLDGLVEGEDAVATFVRDLDLAPLKGAAVSATDQITDISYDRTTGKFSAVWNTTFGENYLINFVAGGSTIQLGRKMGNSPKVRYDTNGDFFVADGSSSSIFYAEPDTSDVNYTYVKTDADSYYVADISGSVVLTDSTATYDTLRLAPTSELSYSTSFDTQETQTLSFSGGSFQTHTIWSSRLGTTGGFANLANGTGEPDGAYSDSAWSGSMNLFLAGFNGLHTGNITKVEVIAQVKTSASTLTDDTLRVYILETNGTKPFFDFAVSDLNVRWESPGLIAIDVTSHKTSWDWGYFDAALTTLDELQFQTARSGAGDGGHIYIDAAGFRITTDVPLTTAAVASPDTTTTETVTKNGETVEYTVLHTDDAGKLFVDDVDLSSVGMTGQPHMRRGKKPNPPKADVVLRAATYGPEVHEQWFVASEAVVRNYKIKSNNGHGNNADGVDVSNPGQGGGGPNGEVDPSGVVDDENANMAGVASSPSPAAGSVGVRESAVLTWSAGSGAVSHDVYFGTTSPPPFVGNQAGTSFTPTGLASLTTYYWRVDEVNAYGARAGTVWSFTVEDLTTSPISGDSFEGGSLADGGWASSNSNAYLSSGAAYNGTSGVQLKKESSIEKSVSTVGMHGIRLSYARQAIGYDGGELLTVEWWDGSAWNLVESTADFNYTFVEHLLPAAAEGNPDFKVRFTTNASLNNETANIDEVSVRGIPD